MADKTSQTPRPRTGRERIKTLTQAALNADVTVEQLDEVLVSLRETLTDLDKSIDGLDTTLGRLNDTISKLDKLTNPLLVMVGQVEILVERFERIAGLGETMMTPLTATEHAVRGAVNAVRKSTGL
jgi:ABC-type transporter Mla subunit MlaD